MEITRRYYKKNKEQHIHSPAHALADELANKFSDRRRFGFYLKMATMYDHNLLRRLAGEALEGKAKNPAALFAYLIKKNNETKKDA